MLPILTRIDGMTVDVHK